MKTVIEMAEEAGIMDAYEYGESIPNECLEAFAFLILSNQARQQKPVAYMHKCGSDVQINNLPAECYGDNWTREPLYTFPPNAITEAEKREDCLKAFRRGNVIGAKRMRDAAVKVCRAVAEAYPQPTVAKQLLEAIAALPVPDVQWRDIPEVANLIDALNAMLTHMGMDEDEWNKPTFDQARAAIAKFKEKQL